MTESCPSEVVDGIDCWRPTVNSWFPKSHFTATEAISYVATGELPLRLKWTGSERDRFHATGIEPDTSIAGRATR